MIVDGRKLTLKEFESLVKKYNFGSNNPNKIVIHHTWKPKVKDWKGKASFDGTVGYYKSKGWRAAPHIFVAPDGIWLMTPMNMRGIHAGVGNWRSIGIEVVGDYDTKKWEGSIKTDALGVIRALMKALGLNTTQVKFHREYNKSKSCPGHSITKEWLFRELNYYKEKHKVPDWGKKAWKWAKDEGVISDKSEFNAPLTKGEFAVLLHRYHNG